MEKYNGWTNYATWKVNLEIFADYELNEYEQSMDIIDLAKIFENMVDEILTSDTGYNSLAYNYATAFIAGIDVYKIAQSLKDFENMVDEILSSDAGFNNLVYSYACAFVADVNFYEIAQSLKDNEV